VATESKQDGRVHAHAESFNLFVYGTLTDPDVFRAVLGRELVRRADQADGVNFFFGRNAVLNGYKKVSPDNTYLYAMPDKGHRIQGLLITALPGPCLPALNHYEGKNYSRRTLAVQTAEGREKAVVFVGNAKKLEHAFGYPFRDPLKQEILLGKKIDAAIRQLEEDQLHTTEGLTRRAVAELSGSTIRDITRRHFEAQGISDYAIRRLLSDRPIPDYNRILDDPTANVLAPNYLRLAMRQVVFNQFEDRIRREFRYELDHLPQAGFLYERVGSLLVSLRLLNLNRTVLDALIDDCLGDMPFDAHHMVDYVRRAVAIADALYDPRPAKAQLTFVSSHMGFGHILLGAELEFSNIGHDVIRDPEGRAHRDPRFDGFFYFRDFGLDVLTWKLGGHIDSHHGKASDRPRRGFFEVALGNLSIEANISKPITCDPWVLNQLIHQAREFYDITPHSVHLSMQLRSQHRPDCDRLPPLEVLQCLFALGGDPCPDEDGRVRLHRLSGGEIFRRRPKPTLLFSEVRKRFSQQEGEEFAFAARGASGRYVQQFRFLRLSDHLNYEPIIMALKGIQLSLRPGSFMTPAQWKSSGKHRAMFETLMEWGQNPTRLDGGDIARFLAHVEDGLRTEKRGRPAHTLAYIAWSLSQIEEMLNAFNEQLAMTD
jgi:gamma-glutamylcyclotransferase (GGCT)/AIG2-like uncharacterized protein YtfP